MRVLILLCESSLQHDYALSELLILILKPLDLPPNLTLLLFPSFPAHPCTQPILKHPILFLRKIPPHFLHILLFYYFYVYPELPNQNSINRRNTAISVLDARRK